MKFTKPRHSTRSIWIDNISYRLIAVVLSMTCVSAFAHLGTGESIMRYKIIEDVFDSTIAEGTTLITGIAKLRKEVLSQGLVGTVDNIKTTTTDANGKFSLKVSNTDSMIYFFKPHFEEIITAKLVFKSQHHITIEFYATENIRIMLSAKPVIYLYSSSDGSRNDQLVNLKLNVHGKTTFTYPKLNECWSVKANQDGMLTDEAGNTYPYLFWEGEHEKQDFEFSKGSINNRVLENSYQIKTDTVVSFLEHQLNAIGLNSVEKTDFITYWGPRLVEKDYALIQFFFDEDYSRRIAELEVDPKPTASLRMYMMFSGADDYHFEVKTKAMERPSFKRTGFTLVEWGGTSVKSNLISF